jgi:hypothetical protein
MIAIVYKAMPITVLFRKEAYWPKPVAAHPACVISATVAPALDISA